MGLAIGTTQRTSNLPNRGWCEGYEANVGADRLLYDGELLAIAKHPASRYVHGIKTLQKVQLASCADSKSMLGLSSVRGTTLE